MLFSVIRGSRKMSGNGQSLKLQMDIKTITSGLAHVGRVRLPSWHSRREREKDRDSDVTQCSSRWNSRIRSLLLDVYFFSSLSRAVDISSFLVHLISCDQTML